MAIYTGRIVVEGGTRQGASVMNIASGASVQVASGAVFDVAGRANFSGELGLTAITAASYGASRLKIGTEMAASGTVTWEAIDFGNGVKLLISLAASLPNTSASPGSLLIHRTGPAGSGARLYINVSNDDGVGETGGSTWRPFNIALASS